MVIHKRTQLTPIQRLAVYTGYYKENKRDCDLASEYPRFTPTIYKIDHRGRLNDFSIHTSTNQKYLCVKYGLRRLAKN